MQALARVRTKAARLRSRPREADEALPLLDEALELTDDIRIDCARLQQENAELQRQLRTRDDEIRELIDSLPAALVHTDCSGLIVEANRAASTLLGLSRMSLRNELLMYFSEDRATFAELVRGLPRTSEPVRASTRIRPRDRAPFDATITLLRDPRRGEGEERWLWFFDRVSAGRTLLRMPAPRAVGPSPSDPSAA
jgi:PAS domain S-box-containing protein